MQTKEIQKNLSQFCEMELVYKTKKADKEVIETAEQAHQSVLHYYNLNTIELRERFVMLLFDRANKLIGGVVLTEGATSACLVDIKHLLGYTILSNATGVILSHNHPSNSMKVSENDVALTKKVNRALGLIDVTLLDHIIVGTGGNYLSMKNEGII